MIKIIADKTLKTLLVLVIITLSLIAAIMTTESGLRWTARSLQPIVPGNFTWQSIKGTLWEGPRITGFHYKNPDIDLRISSIKISWNPLELFSKEICIDRLQANDVDINIHVSEPNSPAIIEYPEIAPLPLSIILAQTDISEIVVRNNERQVFNAENLSLSAHWNAQTLSILETQFGSIEYHVNANAELIFNPNRTSTIDVNWQYKNSELPPLAGHTRVQGNASKLIMQHEQILPGNANIHAVVDELLSNPQWRAQVSWDDMQLQTLNKSLPNNYLGGKLHATGTSSTFDISGEVRSDYVELPQNRLLLSSQGDFSDETVTISMLALSLADSDAQVSGTGQWTMSDKRFEADLQWQELSWPLLQQHEFISPKGNGQITGQLQDYRFQLDATLTGNQIPSLAFIAIGEGNMTQVRFNKLSVDTMDGRIEGQGQVAWQPYVNWYTRISATELNPSHVVKELDGQLNIEAINSGNLNGSDLTMSTTIESVEGWLNGFPVSASGQAELNGTTLDLKDVYLESRNSQLKLSGIIDQQLNIKWNLHSADISVFHSELDGIVQAAGKLGGPKSSPVLSGELTGNTLAAYGTSIESVKLNWQLGMSEQADLQVQVNANAFVYDNLSFENIDISANGNIHSHQLDLTANGKDLAIQVQLNGGWQKSLWQGTLKQANIDTATAGKWHLQKNAPLKIGSEQFDLAQSCWRNVNAHLCLAAATQNTNSWQTQVSIENAPLALFSPWFPSEFDVQGTLNADLQAQLTTDGTINGSGQLVLPPGQYYYGYGNDKKSFAYLGGHIKTSISAESFKGDGEFILQEQNRLSLSWNLDHFKLDKAKDKQKIELRINNQFDDLSVLEPLLNGVNKISGQWNSNIAVSGSLATPQIDGHSKIHNASIDLPDLGILLNNINITLDKVDNERLQLIGMVQSNNAELKLSGGLNLKEKTGNMVNIRVLGENFEVIDTPQAHVLVSPDININFINREVKLEGKLNIPEASIKPRNLNTGVSQSKDVIIVQSDNQRKRPDIIPVHTNLRVTLGHKVWFDGYGLRAWLTGDLSLQDSPDEITTGRGELAVREGTFRAFGNPLTIDTGRLIYSGGAMDNPGLNIAASRNLTSESVLVGVKVTGTIQNPTLKTYAEPPMSQTDTLSYLMFGKKSDDSSYAASTALLQAVTSGATEGVTDSVKNVLNLSEFRLNRGDTREELSLTLGTYLSPKFFFGYTFGIFETDNQLQMRYHLNEQWRIEMETEKEAYSGDVFYSIEY